MKYSDGRDKRNAYCENTYMVGVFTGVNRCLFFLHYKKRYADFLIDRKRLNTCLQHKGSKTVYTIYICTYESLNTGARKIMEKDSHF